MARKSAWRRATKVEGLVLQAAAEFPARPPAARFALAASAAGAARFSAPGRVRAG
ncbi:MAG: hypothetical protein ACREFP_11870 [Acetobacteraceae bacterium]